MRLEPLFEQEMEQIKQEYEERIQQERRTFEERIQQQIQQERRTFEERIQQQIQQERRTAIEGVLRLRFGSMDEELAAIIEPLAALPLEEYTALILQLSDLSREELLTRFRR